VLEVSLELVMLGFGSFLRCQSDKLEPELDHQASNWISQVWCLAVEVLVFGAFPDH
jgi:hypothetical protein